MVSMSLSAGTAGQVIAVGRALGLDITGLQAETLCRYIELMARWNKTYNLTAIRDPQKMLVQHLYDSLSVVSPLIRHVGSQSLSIMDVGSGGGLPGVVLAIMRPDWNVVCVDAVEKKTAFIRQVSGTLKLANLSSRHARIESLPAQACDIVISRAFASLVDFTSWSGHHVRDGGYMVAMKGKIPVEEIRALEDKGDWLVKRTEALTVPELEGERCLLWLQAARGMSSMADQGTAQGSLQSEPQAPHDGGASAQAAMPAFATRSSKEIVE